MENVWKIRRKVSKYQDLAYYIITVWNVDSVFIAPLVFIAKSFSAFLLNQRQYTEVLVCIPRTFLRLELKTLWLLVAVAQKAPQPLEYFYFYCNILFYFILFFIITTYKKIREWEKHVKVVLKWKKNEKYLCVLAVLWNLGSWQQFQR